MAPSGLQVSNIILEILSFFVNKSLGFTNAITLFFKHFANPSIPSPSSVLRITINTGPQAFYGEKYKIDKVSGKVSVTL
jgi:hypothetical protein